MAEVKLCKDCHWCRPVRELNILWWPTKNSWKYAKCGYPHLLTNIPERPNLVSGGKLPVVIDRGYCNILRNYDDYCGPVGKYWEAKP